MSSTMSIKLPQLQPVMAPPPQTGHLPSPSTPTHTTQYPPDYETQCLQFLDNANSCKKKKIHQQAGQIGVLATRNSHLERRIDELQKKGTVFESSITQRDEKIDILNKAVRNLTDDKAQSESETTRLIDSQKQWLQNLEQKHADSLVQTKQEVGKRVDDLEKLNKTYQNEIDKRGEEIASIKSTVASLQEETANANANIDRLKNSNSEHQANNEALTRDAGAQTNKIACLEQQIATNTTDHEQALAELGSAKAALESELAATEQIASMLDDAKKSLAMEMASWKLRCERAELVNPQLREEAEEATDLHMRSKREVVGLQIEIKRLQVSAAATETLRKGLADTAQEHADREQELLELRADRKLLAASQKVESELRSELGESKRHHVDRNKDSKVQREKSDRREKELEESRKSNVDLRAAWRLQEERVKSAESKRDSEQVSGRLFLLMMNGGAVLI